MIPQPMRFVHGQALRPETFNQLLDTLRRITPIAGPGIILHHSPNGTTFSVQHTSAPQPPAFNHPFKVTLEKREESTIAKVLQGAFYTLAEETVTATGEQPKIVATAVALTLENLTEVESGWETTALANGDALFIRQDAEGYALVCGAPDDVALYTIATFSHDTATDRFTVQQHLLSDLYFLESAGVEMPNQEVLVPKASKANEDDSTTEYALALELTEPVEGDRYTDAVPPKLTLKIPTINLKTGEVTQQELTVDLLNVAKGVDGADGSDGEDGEDADLPEAQSLEVVTGVTYDTSTHKLTLTKRTVTGYFTSLGTESDTDVFTATPHSEEHS